jgi:hypothetical protein
LRRAVGCGSKRRPTNPGAPGRRSEMKANLYTIVYHLAQECLDLGLEYATAELDYFAHNDQGHPLYLVGVNGKLIAVWAIK